MLIIPQPMIMYRDKPVCPECGKEENTVTVCAHCGHKYEEDAGIGIVIFFNGFRNIFIVLDNVDLS